MIKVVVDLYGGDFSPEETVKGALLALERDNDLEVVLCGDKEKTKSLLGEKASDSRIEILDAPGVITNDDDPVGAVRFKKDSSLIAGIDYLSANDDAKGFVSTGSSGAVLSAAVLLSKRIRGVNRPALAPILPTVIDEKKVILIDCGVNTEPKANNLLQFAQMGVGYAKLNGVQNPKVGLLSNGAEDKKGNTLTKEAFSLLKESNLNFVGNIEAREILSGDIDVLVSDGFSGNIALKACEGTALSMFSLIKDGIMKGGIRAKIGYLLLKPVLKKIKHTMDYNEYGGAVLVGLEKVIVKAHGSSKANAVANAILQVKSLAEKNLPAYIAQEIQ